MRNEIDADDGGDSQSDDQAADVLDGKLIDLEDAFLALDGIRSKVGVALTHLRR